MDSLKGFLAALAGIGVALGGTLFVIVAALVIIGLFFTGIFAMIGLSPSRSASRTSSAVSSPTLPCACSAGSTM